MTVRHKEQQPSKEAVESLKDTIGNEKARLRWRLTVNEQLETEEERQPPPLGSRRSGRLYEVFRALEAE
jgi:hypothetical protein